MVVVKNTWRLLAEARVHTTTIKKAKTAVAVGARAAMMRTRSRSLLQSAGFRAVSVFNTTSTLTSVAAG
ncbi:hypothetical protein ABH935_009179 [Catenulispora sp. GAS73]|uniref:hypothetical protein n=1 Tax=Catenulispora sp. GAS73 TaxID=3156269 RepID=UPI003513C208